MHLVNVHQDRLLVRPTHLPTVTEKAQQLLHHSESEGHQHHALDDQHVVSADGEKDTGPVDHLVHVDGDPEGDGKVSDSVPGYLRRCRTVAKEYGLSNVEEVGGEDHQGV